MEGTSKDLSTRYARGSSSYRAPELVQEEVQTYSRKVDVWALGCIFYELVTGKIAFPNDFMVYRYAMPGGNVMNVPNLPITPGRWTDVFKLISNMLEIDRTTRPSVEEIIEKLDILAQGTAE
jgi:serine/threonine protein kinase